MVSRSGDLADANANARANGAGPLIRAITANGLAPAALRKRAPFDLICANILARPLCHMAGSAAKALDQGGIIILSGMLTRDAMRVIARHQAHGFHLVSTLAIDGWQSLVMKLG